MTATVHGRFPFGRPNTERPVRPATGDTEMLVVGVYPSAFHVRWSPPPETDPRPVDKRSKPFVGSLAVDVEPTVFWDGVTPSPAEELERWTTAVGFDPKRHGTVSPGTNGPSGAGVIEHYLATLRVDVGTVAFTDAVPWYFVKHGDGSQGAAIDKFNGLAAEMGLDLADLPKRPSRTELRAIVDSNARHDSLREEVATSAATQLVTLGQEALDAVLVVADDHGDVQEALQPDGYAKTGHVIVGGHELAWTPLVHPGFLRQNKDAAWQQAITAWGDSV